MGIARDIVDRDDAGHVVAAVHHREPPKVLSLHQIDDLAATLIFEAKIDESGHDIRNPCPFRIASHSYRATANIAIRNEPDHSFLVGNR